MLLWSLLPLGLATIGHVAGGSAIGKDELFAFVVTAGLTLSILLIGNFGWSVLVPRVHAIEELGPLAFREDASKGLVRIYRFQWVGWLIGAAAALTLQAAFPAGTSTSSLPVSVIASGIGQWMLAIAGGNGIYLAMACPHLHAILIRHRPTLLLYRLEPGQTPGMQVLAQFLGFGSGFLLFSLVTVSLGLLIPRFLGIPLSAPLQFGLTSIYAILAIVIVRFSVVSISRLQRILSETRADSLKELNRIIEIQRSRPFSRGRSERAASEFIHIAGTSNLPFRTEVLVQFGAAAAGSLIAFMLSLVPLLP